MRDFRGKTAFITGGGSGIGLGMVRTKAMTAGDIYRQAQKNGADDGRGKGCGRRSGHEGLTAWTM